MTRDEIIGMADKVGLGFIRHADEKDVAKFERFAELIEAKIREEDRVQAVMFLRQLHDSFSLESAELRIGQWAKDKHE